MTNSDPALTHRRLARQRPAFRPRPAAPARGGPSWADDPAPEIHIERRTPPEWRELPADETEYRPDPGLAHDPDHGVGHDPDYAQARPDYHPGHTPARPEYRQEQMSVPSRQGRTLADFERARRHSRMVGLLKIGLPASGAVALLAIGAIFLLAGGSLPSINIGSTRIVDGKLVMDNPQLKGTDASQRPYNLTARRAVQNADNPSLISLEEIRARLPMAADGFAQITAGNGLYDVDGKKLRLGGKVAVDTADGMTIRLEDADINIDSGTLHTENPVHVDAGRAKVSADTLSVEDKGDRIVFENRVRMTLRPATKKAGDDAGALNDPSQAPTGAVEGEAGAAAR